MRTKSESDQTWGKDRYTDEWCSTTHRNELDHEKSKGETDEW